MQAALLFITAHDDYYMKALVRKVAVKVSRKQEERAGSWPGWQKFPKMKQSQKCYFAEKL